jgi:hypothetical protein
MPDAQTAMHEEEDQWAQESLEELPPRPRRRLLGVGGNTSQIALLGVLLLVCGFIGGVLVEKSQTSSSSSSSAGAGLAARFAALRGGGSGVGVGGANAGTGSTGTEGGSAAGSGLAGGSAARGGFGGGFAGRFGGAAGGAVIGEVSYISGGTLYVTNAEGNTVKVTTSPASSITKTVKADIHGIHPGETVVVRGTKDSGGAISAESVSASAGGVAGAGLSSLFGGGASRGKRSTGSGASGAGGPALFGE